MSLKLIQISQNKNKLTQIMVTAILMVIEEIMTNVELLEGNHVKIFELNTIEVIEKQAYPEYGEWSDNYSDSYSDSLPQ